MVEVWCEEFDQPVAMLFDTGSEVNVASAEIAKKYEKEVKIAGKPGNLPPLAIQHAGGRGVFTSYVLLTPLHLETAKPTTPVAFWIDPHLCASIPFLLSNA